MLYWNYLYVVVYTAVTADLSYFGNVSGYTSYSTFPPIVQNTGHLEIAFNFRVPTENSPVTSQGQILLTVGSPELISQDTEYVLIGMKQNAVVAICNLGGGSNPSCSLSTQRRFFKMPLIYFIGPLLLIPSTRLVPNVTYHVLITLERSSGVVLSVNASSQNASSISRLDFPPNYYFRKFPFPAAVSVGGYGQIDALPLPGFVGFIGSITGLQFRTRSTSSFTSFSRPIGGLNVLPSQLDQQPLCISCTASIISCMNNSCSEDSRCAPTAAAAEYRCDCPLGKSGNFCDTPLSVLDNHNPSFNGLNSYLTYLPTTGLEEDGIYGYPVGNETTDAIWVAFVLSRVPHCTDALLLLPFHL